MLLYPNPLYFIQADLITASVVKLGGSRRRVVGHGCRALQRAAAFQVCRDACGAKRMVSDGCLDTSDYRAPAHHGMCVGLGQNGSA